MKDLSIAVAASILTVFAFAPGLSARTAGAANRDFAAKSEQQSSVAKSIVIAQLSPGMSMNQGEILEAQQNADSPGDDGSSADTDNQNPDDTDQNAANADQNGDPNNPTPIKTHRLTTTATIRIRATARGPMRRRITARRPIRTPTTRRRRNESSRRRNPSRREP